MLMRTAYSYIHRHRRIQSAAALLLSAFLLLFTHQAIAETEMTTHTIDGLSYQLPSDWMVKKSKTHSAEHYAQSTDSCAGGSLVMFSAEFEDWIMNEYDRDGQIQLYKDIITDEESSISSYEVKTFHQYPAIIANLNIQSTSAPGSCASRAVIMLYYDQSIFMFSYSSDKTDAFAHAKKLYTTISAPSVAVTPVPTAVPSASSSEGSLHTKPTNAINFSELYVYRLSQYNLSSASDMDILQYGSYAYASNESNQYIISSGAQLFCNPDDLTIRKATFTFMDLDEDALMSETWARCAAAIAALEYPSLVDDQMRELVQDNPMFDMKTPMLEAMDIVQGITDDMLSANNPAKMQQLAAGEHVEVYRGNYAYSLAYSKEINSIIIFADAY